MNYPSSGLAPSASEFVPGQYYSRDPSAGNFQTDSELNSTASEWVPGSGATSSGLNNMKDVSYSLQEASAYNQSGTDGSNENMVEVYWNGASIFVPESSTYVGEDGTIMYMGDGDGTAAVDASGALTGQLMPKHTVHSLLCRSCSRVVSASGSATVCFPISAESGFYGCDSIFPPCVFVRCSHHLSCAETVRREYMSLASLNTCDVTARNSHGLSYCACIAILFVSLSASYSATACCSISAKRGFLACHSETCVFYTHLVSPVVCFSGLCAS